MTKANEEHRYLGKTDEPLSEKGIRFIEEKKKTYPWKENDLIYASPMKRCIQTAELLFDTEPILIPEWEEMDFGQFEGKNYEELKDNPAYQQWIDSNGTLPFPDGESREQFIARCMKGFHQMTEDIIRYLNRNDEMLLHTDQPSLNSVDKKLARKSEAEKTISVVAVVHGGTIMALLSSLTGAEYFDFQLKNGEGYETIFSIIENQWQLDAYQKLSD